MWPEFIIWDESPRVLTFGFDCAFRPPFNFLTKFEVVNMLSVIAGTFIILSIGILVAHALDLFRSN